MVTVLQRWGWSRLRETTLIAAARWGLVALAFAVAAAAAPGDDRPYLRYAAAVFALAPTLAQLGAKRPQNGAWQFIVLTLVGVLLLPVLQGWAFGDERPHVHTLFRWLIAAHIVVGTVNYLPTRYAGPAILLGLAQILLAADYLPWPMPAWRYAAPAAVVCLIEALLWASYEARRTIGLAPGPARLWRDFRDAYGLVWGLRIAERMNAAAAQHQWPVEFNWKGIREKSMGNGEWGMGNDAEMRRRVERELRTLLRRFVSHEWIARRMTGERS